MDILDPKLGWGGGQATFLILICIKKITSALIHIKERILCSLFPELRIKPTDRSIPVCNQAAREEIQARTSRLSTRNSAFLRTRLPRRPTLPLIHLLLDFLV